jgi:hypothetical protein
MTSPEIYTEVLRRLKQFLPNIPEPAVNLNCETKCPEAGTCKLLGCYYNGTINLKTGVPAEVLVHEYGHHIFNIAMGGRVNKAESEKFARFFEDHFGYNIACDVCGNSIVYFPSGSTIVGYCPSCRTGYAMYADTEQGSSLEDFFVGVVCSIIGTLFASAIIRR